jgi:hypothetical protein
MAYAFISYSHKDTAFVDRLARDLRAQHVEVWVDRNELMPGSNWTNAIESALQNADAVLFVVSPNSATSSWVQLETRAALQHTTTGTGKLIIPIVFGRPISMPPELAQIQWVDFTDNYEQALRQLLAALPETVRSVGNAQPGEPQSKGYFFLSFADEDSEFVEQLRQFLREKKYGYWDFEDSERDYGLQFYLEIEKRISQAAAVLSILSPDWKLSKWAPREYLFAEEVGIPTFLLMVRPMGPTLLTAGMTYIDFNRDPRKAFGRLDGQLRRKKL